MLKKLKRCFNIWAITCCIFFLIGVSLHCTGDFARIVVGDYIILLTWPTALAAFIFREYIRKDTMRWEEIIKNRILFQIPTIMLIVAIMKELLRKDTRPAGIVLYTGALILCIWTTLLGIASWQKRRKSETEEITECAKQEDSPIYEGDKEVDMWVRLSDVENAINKHINLNSEMYCTECSQEQFLKCGELPQDTEAPCSFIKDTVHSNQRLSEKGKIVKQKSLVTKENTHIVIKQEDAIKYLTEVEYCALDKILNTVSEGRNKDGKNPFNNYYICNTDEPYAEIVHGIIMGGEAVKNKHIN